jgi:hypothetical protein
MSSFRLALAMPGRWSARTAVLTLRRVIPPNRAASGILPRGALDDHLQDLARPGVVAMTALYFPPPAPIAGVPHLLGINGCSLDSPTRPAPRLWPPDGGQGPRASLCPATPAISSGARQGGAGHEHAPGTELPTLSALQTASSLARCGLVSQRQMRMQRPRPSGYCQRLAGMTGTGRLGISSAAKGDEQ